jgi:hypothetical protein
MPDYPEYLPTPGERVLEIGGVIVLAVLLLPLMLVAVAQLAKERGGNGTLQ